MKRFFLAASALVVLFGSSSSPVVAKGHYVKGPYNSPYVYSQPVRVRYLPPTYRNWSRYSWLARYGCYLYYSDGWYYWYAPRRTFLPITYLQTYPPVVVDNTLPVGTPVGPLGVAPLPAGVAPPLPTP